MLACAAGALPGCHLEAALLRPAASDAGAKLLGAGVWPDPRRYLANRLTEAERAQFAEEGCILIEDALGPAEIQNLTELLDRTHVRNSLEAEQRPDPAMPDAMCGRRSAGSASHSA
eukprot:SAG11_NODE_21294_length_428_cov_0.629179_1_plen_115_part_10